MTDNPYDAFDDDDAAVVVAPTSAPANIFDQFDGESAAKPEAAVKPKTQQKPAAQPPAEELPATPGISFTDDPEVNEAVQRLAAANRKDGLDAENKARGDGFISGVTDPQQYAEFAKGIPPGAVRFFGTALKGASALPASAQYNAAGFGRKQIDIMDRVDRGETVPELDDAYGYQWMSAEQRQRFRAEAGKAAAAFNPTPLAERGLFKAGEAVSEYARTILPVAPGYEEAVGRQLGEGVGSLVAGLPAGFIGRIPSTILFGVSGSGEAVERAADFDRAERVAGRPGLSEEDMALAGVYGVVPGTTDVLPLEVLMGRLKIPAPWRPAFAKVLARIGGQAFVEGVQEGGQQFLQNEIAKEIYNPKQLLTEDVLPNIGVGVGVGGIAETAKSLGELVLKRIAGRRARLRAARQPFPGDLSEPAAPAAEATPTEAAPAPRFEPRIEKPAEPRGVDVIQFIRNKGGIQPSGELDAIDAKRYPGLVSANGLSADKIREAMVEAGYLEETGPDQPAVTTPQDVFDLVGRSIGGEKVYPVKEQAGAESRQAQEASHQAERELQAAETNFVLPEIEAYDKEAGSPVLAEAYAMLNNDEKAELIERNRRGEDVSDLIEELYIRSENEDGTAIETPPPSPEALQQELRALVTERSSEAKARRSEIEQQLTNVPAAAAAPGAGITGETPGAATEPPTEIRSGITPPATIPDAQRSQFREILAGTTSRKQWAAELGADPAQMDALIRDAEAQGLLRVDRNGIVRRTAKARTDEPTPEEQMLAIRAYHGSPHAFERFDLSRIGTGEGAQVFGHGLYFAENEATAKAYQLTLAGRGVDTNAIAKELLPDLYKAQPTIASEIYREASGGSSPSDAAKNIQMRVREARDADNTFGKNGPNHKRLIEAIAAMRKDIGGHLYEVSLDVEPEQLLDWDKPLSEQSEGVKAALAKLGFDAAQVAEDMFGGKPSELAARELYQWLEGVQEGGLGSPEAISQALREAGIPGIRYLDQFSRTPIKHLYLNGKALAANDDAAVLVRVALANNMDDKVQAVRYLQQQRNMAIDAARPAYDQAMRYLLDRSLEVREEPSTRNIVIFDDSLIKITHKNGEPVTKQERADALEQMHDEQDAKQMFALRGGRTEPGLTPSAAGQAFANVTDETAPLPARIAKVNEILSEEFGFANIVVPESEAALKAAEKAVQGYRLISEVTGLPTRAIGATRPPEFAVKPEAKLGSASGEFQAGLIRRTQIRLVENAEAAVAAHEWAHYFDNLAGKKGFFLPFIRTFASTPINRANFALDVLSLYTLTPYNVIRAGIERMTGRTFFPRGIANRFPRMKPKVAEGFSELMRALHIGREQLFLGRNKEVDAILKLKRKQDKLVSDLVDPIAEQTDAMLKWLSASPGGSASAKAEYESVKAKHAPLVQEYEKTKEDYTKRIGDLPSYLRALAEDNGRPENYYTQPAELLARSFEVYVRQRAIEQGYDPQTLTANGFGREGTQYIKESDANFQDVMNAWDKIFSNIRVEQGDQLAFALRGFYSPAIRAAESITQEKGTGEQFWKQITKVPGVRRDELDWMGLEEFLKDKKSVTKAEVLDFMRANQVQLEEKVLGDTREGQVSRSEISIGKLRNFLRMDEDELPDGVYTDIERFAHGKEQAFVVYDPSSRGWFVLDDSGNPRAASSRDQALHMATGYVTAESKTAPKFGEFKVPGGDNYRELLIRLPELAGGEKSPEWQRLTKRIDEINSAVEADPSQYKALEDEFDRLTARRREIERTPGYENKHFQDQELVHLRVDDRSIPMPGPSTERAATIREQLLDLNAADPEAKALREELNPKQSVLHLNEVQSDLHQAAQGFGYGAEGLKAAKDAISSDGFRPKEHEEYFQLRNEGDRGADALAERARKRVVAAENYISMFPEGAPNVPLKGDLWLELALKRMLQYAVENGYDAISWARSDQIAKAVGAEPEKLALQYDQKIGKFLDKYTKKWGGKVEEEKGIVAPEKLQGHVELGDGYMSQHFYKPMQDLLPKPFNSDHYAREAFKEIGPTFDVIGALKELAPDNVAKAQKLLDAYKAHLTPRPEPNPILRITPQMRDSIARGQPLFARSDNEGRIHVIRQLSAGRAVDVEPEIVTQNALIIHPIARRLPSDINLGMVSRLEPVKGKDYYRATFTRVDGSTFQAPLTDEAINKGRAFFSPSLNIIASLRFGTLGNASADQMIKTLSGEVHHEVVHALWHRLPAALRSALASHANALGVLNLSLRQYLRLIGDPSAKLAHPDEKIREGYEEAYENRKNLSDLLDQEAAAHMTELYSHGLLTDEEVAPVKGLLDAIISDPAGLVERAAGKGGAQALLGLRHQQAEILTNPSRADIAGLLRDIAKERNRPAGAAMVPLRWSIDSQNNLYVGDSMQLTHDSLGRAGGAEPKPISGYVSRRGQFIQVIRNPMRYDEIPEVKAKVEAASRGTVLHLDDRYEANPDYDMHKVLQQQEGGAQTLLAQRGANVPVTETPAFKRWFGDSKVVDENGKPIVVYHATRNEFDVFNTNPEFGIGSHFGTQRAAHERLDQTRKGEIAASVAGDRVLPVFLKINNPLELPDLQYWTNDDIAKAINEVSAANDLKIKHIETKPGFLGSRIYEKNDILDALRSTGYDGISYKNKYEDIGSTSYIALDPTQIKSAIGNRGTFDPSNPDIVFAARAKGPDLTDTFADIRAELGLDAGDETATPRQQIDAIAAQGARFVERYGDAVADQIAQTGGPLALQDPAQLAETFREFVQSPDAFRARDRVAYDAFADALDAEAPALLEAIDAMHRLVPEEFPKAAAGAATGTRAMQATAGKIPDSRARQARAGTERPDQSLADLVGGFNRALGLTVRQGRLSPGMKMRAAKAGQDLRGQTSMETGVVRLRVPNEIDTLAHEGGHALENRFKGELDALKQKHASELTPLASPGPDALSEGFAEWFRRYVTNPAASQRTAPRFEAALEELLKARDPAMLASLAEIRKGYQAWINAPSGGVIASDMVSTVPPGSMKSYVREFKEEGLRRTFQNWMDRAYTAVFDDLHPVRLAVDGLLDIARQNFPAGIRDKIDVKTTDNAYKLLRLARDGYAAGHMDLLYGVHDYRAIQPRGPSLREAIATAFGGFDKRLWNEEISTDFNAYLRARRMVQEWGRFKRGEISAPPDKFSLADHSQAIRDFESKYPGFAQGASQVYIYQRNMLRKKRDAGLITPELYDELIKRQDYVPVMRDMSDRGGRVEGRKGARKDKFSVISKFRGSQRDVINPLESIAKDTYETGMIIARNDALKALDALARAAGPNGGQFAERIPAHEMKASQVNVIEALKSAARDAGIDPADMQIMLQAVDDQLGDNAIAQIWKAGEISEKGEPIVYLWENGKRIPIRLADGQFGHDMLHAITGMSRESTGWFVNLMSLPTTALRFGVTASLDFIGANFIRDQVSAWVLTRDFVPFWDGAKGIYSDLTLKDVSRIYSRVGGIMGGSNVAAQHESRIKREILELRRKGIRFTLNPFTRDFWRMTEFSESGARLAVFQKAFDRAKVDGLNDWEAAIDAAFVARDYIDFGRYGSRMLGARRLIPFLNAALQGLDRTVRGATGKVDADRPLRTLISPYIKSRTGQPLTIVEQGNLRQSAQVWGYMVALGMISLGLSLLYKDDEEYEEISDYIKATHWLIRLNGEWVRIPKPFEIAFFANFVERTFDYVYRGDPTAAERFGSGLLEIIVPPHSLPGLQVTTELITDYDFFSGRPIVGSQLKSLPPELQFNAYASEFGKWLGKGVNISPAYIDHFITGFGASYGREFVNASDTVMPALGRASGGLFGLPTGPTADKAFEDYFFLRRFTTDPTRGSTSVRQFWQMMAMENGSFTQAANGYRHLVDKVRDAKGAQEFLDSLPEEERAYALLQAGNSQGRAKYRRLHPLNRAHEIVTIAGAMRREINLDRLYEGKQGKQGDKIDLTPAQMRTVSDLLSDITMREARNALVALKVRGWEQKAPLPTETVYKELDAVASKVHDEFVHRLNSKKLPSYETAVKAWPIVRERILEEGPKAIISDLYERDYAPGEGVPLQ